MEDLMAVDSLSGRESPPRVINHYTVTQFQAETNDSF